MKRHSRILAGVLAVLFLAAPSAHAGQALAATDVAAFLGTWTLSVQSPQGPFDQTLELKNDGGKVAAVLTSAMSPDPTAISDISKDGDNLVLKFAGDFQGNAFSAKITMTPDGTDKAKVSFDVMDGQFVMDGTGVKK